MCIRWTCVRINYKLHTAGTTLVRVEGERKVLGIWIVQVQHLAHVRQDLANVLSLSLRAASGGGGRRFFRLPHVSPVVFSSAAVFARRLFRLFIFACDLSVFVQCIGEMFSNSLRTL